MSTQTDTPKVILTIAGSDSSAGAGIQADLKTIVANGGYACSVITAVTAQNTRGVIESYPLPPDLVKAQIEAIFSDFNVAAVKIGMLGTAAIVKAVIAALKKHHARNIVCDPVMLSTSGKTLLEQEGVALCRKELFPICTLITPNLPEFAALTGLEMPLTDSMLTASRETLGSRWLLVKGGHTETADYVSDWLVGESNEISQFNAQRIETRNSHGTGCTLSSAIATNLAKGLPMPEAVRLAKTYLTTCLAAGAHWQLGDGHGPMNHFPVSVFDL